MSKPFKNRTFVIPIHLFKNGDVVTNPTIAAGDFEVITDDTSGGTLDTTPTVTPASGDQVKVSLSAAEMNGDYVTVICKDDTDPKAWDDVTITIQTENFDGVLYGACGATSLTTTTCSSDLSGYDDDQLIGRLINFTSGPADGESSEITDYASASGVLTFNALTTAPANTNTFTIT